jgi:hypothetical protein
MRLSLNGRQRNPGRCGRQEREILYTAVAGRAPLDNNELRYFQELVTAKADEIVAKWIDFFVLHKSVSPERITKRLK